MSGNTPRTSARSKNVRATAVSTTRPSIAIATCSGVARPASAHPLSDDVPADRDRLRVASVGLDDVERSAHRAQELRRRDPLRERRDERRVPPLPGGAQPVRTAGHGEDRRVRHARVREGADGLDRDRDAHGRHEAARPRRPRAATTGTSSQTSIGSMSVRNRGPHDMPARQSVRL